MSSRREAVLAALFTRLAGLAPTVLRNEALPQRAPDTALVILRDGRTRDAQALMSPPAWLIAQEAQIELFVPGTEASARDAELDALLVALSARLATDRTLGGLADHVETGPPEPADVALEGALALKAALVPVTLYFEAPDPLA